MDPVLRLLLSAPPTPPETPSPAEWWEHHRALVDRFPHPADLALAGGFLADRPAWAFASGYQAALRALVPALPADARAALCATEEGGAHPDAITTRLEPAQAGLQAGLTVTGRKEYVTLGTEAERLLVVASEGRGPDGRSRLRLVQVGARAPGVRVTQAPPPPFVPELPHARLTLEDVRVEASDVLPGDGYARYLKPFRTVEDCHVHAALLAWVLQVARRSRWPDAACESLGAQAVTFRALAEADPTSPAVHVALGGALALASRTLSELEPLWAGADAPARERWARDRPLLQVAGKARAQRLEAARRRLQDS